MRGSLSFYGGEAHHSDNLEQFLYAHRISFDSQHRKNGLTHWCYSVNTRLLDVLREYLSLYQEDGSCDDTHRFL